jgi:Amt family ammonium transporter
MVYLIFAELCLAMRVDDPLDAFAVHFGGGLWGLVSACLVTEKGILFALIGTDSSGGGEAVKMDEALWVKPNWPNI